MCSNWSNKWKLYPLPDQCLSTLKNRGCPGNVLAFNTIIISRSVLSGPALKSKVEIDHVSDKNIHLVHICWREHNLSNLNNTRIACILSEVGCRCRIWSCFLLLDTPRSILHQWPSCTVALSFLDGEGGSWTLCRNLELHKFGRW